MDETTAGEFDIEAENTSEAPAPMQFAPRNFMRKAPPINPLPTRAPGGLVSVTPQQGYFPENASQGETPRLMQRVITGLLGGGAEPFESPKLSVRIYALAWRWREFRYDVRLAPGRHRRKGERLAIARFGFHLFVAGLRHILSARRPPPLSLRAVLMQNQAGVSAKNKVPDYGVGAMFQTSGRDL